MTAASPLQVPRASYASAMAAATAAGLLVAGIVAAALGGDAKTVACAVLALATASVATFIPVAMTISPDHWGVVVLFSGTGRSLGVLALTFVMDRAGSGLATRALFFGAVAGAIVILIAESAAAIRILSQLERRRVALKQAPH